MCEGLLMSFEKYQTFIVGILGFGGVIFTIYMNARLSRVQHERQVTHDREALRTALSSELGLIKKILSGRCEQVDEERAISSAFYPEHISTEVYVHFIGNIGLLTQREIEAVIEAYALVNDLPIRLKLLSTDHDSSFDRPGYIHIDAKHGNTAIGIHKSFLPKIEHAIQTLINSGNQGGRF